MYNHIKTSFQKHIDFIIIDIIVMEISFVLACFFRYKNFLLLENSEYRVALSIIFFANLIACYIFNSMQDVLKRNKQLEFYATLKHVVFVEIMLLIFLFVTKTTEAYSRNVITWFTIIYFFITYIVRLIYKSILKKILKNNSDKSIVIICDAKSINNIKEQFETGINDYTIKEVFSYIDNESEIIDYILHKNVDEVFCIGHPNSTLVSKIVEMGVVLHIELEDIGGVLNGNSKVLIENISDMPMLTCTLNTISPIQLFIKTIIDILSGIIGSIITFVLFIIIGPIIKMKSKGPIFFAQDRVGKNGKIFKIYKFRSMVVDAEERKKELIDKNNISSDKMFKLDNDPRIIPGIGNFIRKTSIDEFPQFFNILKGDMSLVGTRPPTVDEWEKYDLHHRTRLAIKPGLTGLWQVSGRSEIKNFEDVVKLDSKYIKNFSLWQDFSIIFKTFKVIFSGKGAE